MKTNRFTPRRQQEGAILIVTLIMLIVITLVTVASVRSTTVDERMAGNARDRNKALQAAEAAVRNCLNMVNAGTYPTAAIQTPTGAGTPAHWDVAATWTTSSTSSVAVAMPTAELAEDPRCLVETLGSAGSFRVTGRARGGSADTIVMLQATYSTD